MYCRKCGKPLVEGASFCGGCGTPIQTVELPKPIEEKIEIIEVKDEKLPSLESDEKVLGIILCTLILSLILIGIL